MEKQLNELSVSKFASYSTGIVTGNVDETLSCFYADRVLSFY